MDEVILRPLHHHHLQKKHRRRFPCTFAKHQEWIWQGVGGRTMEKQMRMKPHDMSLGGGFKYFVFSPLPGQMIQFDWLIFFRSHFGSSCVLVDEKICAIQDCGFAGALGVPREGGCAGCWKSPEAEAQAFPNTPSSFGFEEHWQAFQAPHLRGEQTGEILAKPCEVRFRFSTRLRTSQQCVRPTTDTFRKLFRRISRRIVIRKKETELPVGNPKWKKALHLGKLHNLSSNGLKIRCIHLHLTLSKIPMGWSVFVECPSWRSFQDSWNNLAKDCESPNAGKPSDTFRWDFVEAN